MTVAELIMALRELEPTLPVYRGGGNGGEYEPLAIGGIAPLMSIKRGKDKGYTVDSRVPLWKKFKGFGEPFAALVL